MKFGAEITNMTIGANIYMQEMKVNVLACLGDVPLLQIQRLAHFMIIYILFTNYLII
jgi:hypothetical protein